ncbi:DUF5320 domain-containing protein [Methanoculleus chikugoensis]|uniref:DUF5320 domain-containing protein n=1 Tax=Methanoculleus chikugoensis TaxID=118126 RepID=A0ABN5XK75_9EURY|nr:DUF5320 domain-containing protein [Methanoculleus chikugoensis]BBL69149.1 hypothetical protein MchiMG62_23300 [Methanoculleus chikugoensis]
MPEFDGTGPRGMGPMAGRRMGRCVLPPQPPAEGSTAGETGEIAREAPVQQSVYSLGRGGIPYGCGRGRGFGGGRRRRR